MLRGSGKPKPFQRKSISVSTEIQDIKKEWRDVDPREVEVGDIILGQGLVVGLGEVVKLTDPFQYRFTYQMKNGSTHRVWAQPDTIGALEGDGSFRMLTTVRAFTRARG